MSANSGSVISRSDRHVIQGRMRVGAGAPVKTLVFNVEEALRLCSLPGESEGRVYFFRHLRVAGLPENGDRRTWLEAFQKALLDLARSAVYGRHPSAPTAGEVYFLSQSEACECLMRSMLQRRAADAWFWPVVSGADPADGASVHVACAIEKLSSSAASWMAVAAAVFALGDPVSLLDLLPESQVRRWLWEIGKCELGSTEAPVAPHLSVRVAGTALISIARAVAAWGREDPRVVWLASLAVIITSPVAMEDGTAVRSASMVLQTMPVPESTPEPKLPGNKPASSFLGWGGLQSAESLGPARSTERETSLPGNTRRSERPVHSDSQLSEDASYPNGREVPPSHATLDVGHPIPEARDTHPRELTQEQPVPIGALSDALTSQVEIGDLTPLAKLGEKTLGAGLFFLLNALRYLGIADANVTHAFLAHLFLQLARRAGIDDHDPILLWTQLTLADNEPVQIDQRQLRIWAWKVRRWCWKNASISAVDVVRRSGIVTLTRTDLDVSLSIDSADIRIRRAGLDLDPGWLPWFGRVVRFHYRDRGELQ